MNIFTLIILLCALVQVPFMIEGHVVNWVSFFFCTALAWNSWCIDRKYR